MGILNAGADDGLDERPEAGQTQARTGPDGEAYAGEPRSGRSKLWVTSSRGWEQTDGAAVSRAVHAPVRVDTDSGLRLHLAAAARLLSFLATMAPPNPPTSNGGTSHAPARGRTADHVAVSPADPRGRRQATPPGLGRLARWLVCVLAGVASFAFAGAQVSREYDLKAVFLYNFAAFVEWPPAAFEEPDAPFVVGVVGADPFGAVLDEIVANEFVGSHRIEIRRLDRGDELAACHIVFISGSEGRRVQSILRRVENLPVLTVSDLPHFVDYGGMIGFIRENDQLELVINTEAMRAGQLIASSKLLELAQIVDVAGLEP